MKYGLLIALGVGTLSACGMSESDINAVATAGEEVAFAVEVADEANKVTDADAIAKSAVADVDTSGLDALSN